MYEDLVPTYDLCAALDAHGWSTDTQYYWLGLLVLNAPVKYVVNFGTPVPQLPLFTHAPQEADFPTLPSGYTISQRGDGKYEAYNGSTAVPYSAYDRHIDTRAALWASLQV